MTTYLCAMPFLIYNLGVEMVYILVQRLKAQNITPDKSVKGIRTLKQSFMMLLVLFLIKTF
jgi:hypothetical protein